MKPKLTLAFVLAAAAILATPTARADVSSAQKERRVGLFYFLWLGEQGRAPARDISKILAADPKAGAKPDSPVWGPVGFYHHWGEPLFGYYYSDDEWVVRRHAKLLIQAKVDFLFFDTTNGPIYEKNARLVMRVLQEYHDAGWPIPRVMFYTNSNSGQTAQRIYDAVYKPGFCRDTWFALHGKPVIVAKAEECSPALRGFFTIVKSQWPNAASQKGGWPWMDFTRPQRLFPGEAIPESVMNVSVAQHPKGAFGDSAFYGERGNWGRAFHGGANDPAPGAWTNGYNFCEQWDRACEANPDIVLVTGWNEWIAGRWQGRTQRPLLFVDCANAEYSRDIEMMRGGYGDNYFRLLVREVRRYKRLAPETPPRPAADGKRHYRCFADGGFARNAAGSGTNYVNRTARNVPKDIAVSATPSDLVFEIATQKPVVGSAKLADEWMTVLIGSPDEAGYRYAVRGTRIERLTGDNLTGTPLAARTACEAKGTSFTLRVPRAAIGLAAPGPFTFKFVDSTEPCRTVIDLYDHGCAEPLGRIGFPCAID